LERLPLPFVGPLVNEQPQPRFGARPNIAFEAANRQEIEPVQPNVAEMAFPDMRDEHAQACIVGGRLSKLTGAGDVATADVEPIAG